MTKFIFHGGGVDLKTGRNDGFYKELLEDVPNKGMVLLVYFASRDDDISENATNIAALCKELAVPKEVHVEVAEKDAFLEQIARADAVFFRGGSTEKLITSLKEYSNLKECFEGKTVAGSSAGAYALSAYYASHYYDDAARGLNIAPVRVATHIESGHMPPRPGAVDALQHVAPNLKLVLLTEGAWEVVTV